MLIVAVQASAQSQGEFMSLTELILEHHIEEARILDSGIICSSGPHIHISDAVVTHKGNVAGVVFTQREAGFDVCV